MLERHVSQGFPKCARGEAQLTALSGVTSDGNLVVKIIGFPSHQADYSGDLAGRRDTVAVEAVGHGNQGLGSGEASCGCAGARCGFGGDLEEGGDAEDGASAFAYRLGRADGEEEDEADERGKGPRRHSQDTVSKSWRRLMGVEKDGGMLWRRR